MGMKLKKAMYNGREINIDEASDEMRGNLFCHICGVELTYVNGYTKEVNEKEYYVHPYFRLKNKNKNNDHASDCKYNTQGQLKIMAKESTDNILEDLQNGKFNFRLHLISNSIRELDKDGDNHKLDETDNNLPQKEKEYKKKKEKLDSYLSTMRRLVQLRAELEENKDISSQVTLEFNNKGKKQKISWNHFYYEVDRFYDCYEYLKSKRPQHPICIYGKIRDITDPKPEYNFYSIKLYSPKPIEVDGIFQLPAVEIRIRNNDLIDLIKPYKGKDILVYSKLWAAPSYNWTSLKSGNKKYCYFDIKGELFHKNQFVIFD